MNDLIKVVNNGLEVSSLIIAKLFEREHYNVLASIEKLIKKGRIFKGTGLNTKVSKKSYIDKSGRTLPMYNLSERDFLVAMPFIGGEKAEEGQEILVDEFLRLQKLEILRLNVIQTEYFSKLVKKTSKEKKLTKFGMPKPGPGAVLTRKLTIEIFGNNYAMGRFVYDDLKNSRWQKAKEYTEKEVYKMRIRGLSYVDEDVLKPYIMELRNKLLVRFG